MRGSNRVGRPGAEAKEVPALHCEYVGKIANGVKEAPRATCQALDH